MEITYKMCSYKGVFFPILDHFRPVLYTRQSRSYQGIRTSFRSFTQLIIKLLKVDNLNFTICCRDDAKLVFLYSSLIWS